MKPKISEIILSFWEAGPENANESLKDDFYVAICDPKLVKLIASVVNNLPRRLPIIAYIMFESGRRYEQESMLPK